MLGGPEHENEETSRCRLSQVHDFASWLLREHGDKAQLIAAQRMLECEKRGDRSEAEDWRRMRDTLKEMKGPLAS